MTLGKPLLKGGKVMATVVRHGAAQGIDRQVPAPQALPAAEDAPAGVHGSEGHGHQRGLSTSSRLF